MLSVIEKTLIDLLYECEVCTPVLSDCHHMNVLWNTFRKILTVAGESYIQTCSMAIWNSIEF